jgi:colanic acid/amylovoran biosynthesis protein
VVFTLTAEGQQRPRRDSPRNGPIRALFSVREWNQTGPTGKGFSFRQYQDALRGAAHALERDGAGALVAMSTCQGVPNYRDDSTLAMRIFDGTRTTVDRCFHSPDDLLCELSAADLVVATRMHMAILSLISQVPVIAIAYEFKTLELFNSLGLADDVIAIENLTEQWLIERIRAARSRRGPQLSAETLKALRSEALIPALTIRQLRAARGSSPRTARAEDLLNARRTYGRG